MPSLSYPVLNTLMPGKNLHQSSFRGNTGNLDNLMHPTNDLSGKDGQVSKTKAWNLCSCFHAIKFATLLLIRNYLDLLFYFLYFFGQWKTLF